MAVAISASQPTISERITVYPADDRFTGPRPSVLVLPGGRYRELPPHEGEGYARWLSSIGLHAFVLAYRLLPEQFPAPLEDARAALGHIRGGEHGLDVGSVGVIGSSAGGHLAGLLMTGTVLSTEDGVVEPPRPDFAILAYALADFDLLPPVAVEGLLGDLMFLKDELSPAKHVDSTVCPTFVWATSEDPPGLPNALEWTRVLAEAGVPVELHVLPRGGHGIGLADGVEYGGQGHVFIKRDAHTATWTDSCERWLRHEGVLTT
ncbi:alpha/beta hydrolase [Stackebrandtia nassauensis]|uniref:Xylanase n=1 Tax=Stackebrandtia nassauensis (strain DSM 44728 / CIP 108903 / NRRL B-16338 / NBRC 102104 / LLR-40K-21) TaxID=446470 RepID=D3Q816_STANL|nr:alpha/beta hydrolase [Stackebrandtia nassauensis]ADD40521.1 xylanase [Stackebrandtia nassauensis DSM 44728]